jgi:hypothetical protein
VKTLELPGNSTLLNAIVSSSADSALGPLNLLALLSSAAILFIAWQAWSARPRLADADQTPRTTLPDDLHPSYAGVLATGRVRDTQIEAAVLELIRRGAFVLEPDGSDRTKVQMRIADGNQAQNPLEEQLIDLLRSREREGVVSYAALSRLRNSWGGLRTRLQQDTAAQGWINPSVVQLRLAFFVPGLIGVMLAVVLVFVAIVAGTGWPVLGAVIVGIVGLTSLSIGNVIPHTTMEGERAAVPWRGLRSGLAQARTGSADSVDLDQLFPYIVSMGMAAQYDRYLRRASQTGYVPVWIGRRSRVLDWPEGWHTYWIALHTALAPTDPANTTAPEGSAWRRSLTGGRF